MRCGAGNCEEKQQITEPGRKRKRSIYDDASNGEGGRSEVQKQPKVQVGRSEVGFELGEVEIMEPVDCF